LPLYIEEEWGYDWGYLSRRTQNTPTFAMLTGSIIRKTQPKHSDCKLFDNSSSAGLFGLLPSPGIGELEA
jgi:hypothetical protein